MIFAWLFCLGWIAFVIFSQRKIHPKALFYLFFVELWERFSYYGMRALLMLYMTSELINGGLGYEDSNAYGVYAAYGALVYTTPLIGGYLAEKVMGYRKAIMWGAILMALGHFAMAFENQTIFFAALSLLILGNGFFKPNISSMIGKFYEEGDPRRDGAFTIFYMGINIGAFLTPLTCGTIGELEGWHYGFSLAGFGMLIGLIIFWFAQKNALEDKGFMSEEAKHLNETKSIAGLSPLMWCYIGSFLALPVVWGLVNYNRIVEYLLPIMIIGVIVYMIWMSFTYEAKARQRIWVIVTLFFFTAVFWSFFELAGSALTLFTDRNVDKNVFGFELTTTFFIAVNPFFIMMFAPIFSWLWLKLGRSGMEPAAPIKFAIGLMLLGAGFLVLNLGSSTATAGAIGGIFVVLLYLLHTLGELTLSPVGLSLVTKLAPAKIVGFVMGFWMLSSAVAHMAGAPIARLTAINESEILGGDSFKSCMTDSNISQCLNDPSFTACLKDGGSVDACIASKEFLTNYNKKSSTPYYVAVAKIAGSANKTTRFITSDKSYQGSENLDVEKMKELDTKQVAALTAGSPATIVGSCIAKDSLGLCLGVFTKLGFFAIGCGIFLLLLSPIITKWMHGIK